MFRVLFSLVDGATKVNQAIEQPSAHAKSMWNSVVSWMKMAVDFIALDSTIESLPTTMPHGKVQYTESFHGEQDRKRLTQTMSSGSCLIKLLHTLPRGHPFTVYLTFSPAPYT